MTMFVITNLVQPFTRTEHCLQKMQNRPGTSTPQISKTLSFLFGFWVCALAVTSRIDLNMERSTVGSSWTYKRLAMIGQVVVASSLLLIPVYKIAIPFQLLIITNTQANFPHRALILEGCYSLTQMVTSLETVADWKNWYFSFFGIFHHFKNDSTAVQTSLSCEYSLRYCVKWRFLLRELEWLMVGVKCTKEW